MKLGVVCCTYLRPDTLGELIGSFERQDYPRDRRELVVLDDAGQYIDEQGSGWRVVSRAERFPTLGQKRNAAARLVSDDVEAFVVADDDDIYLPHWLGALAHALTHADWAVPSRVLVWSDGSLGAVDNWGTYHSAWAYRRSMFEQLGGYAPLNNGEDQEFALRARRAGFTWVDPCQESPPYLICRMGAAFYQTSDLDDDGYSGLGCHLPARPVKLQVGWNEPYDLLAASLLR